MADTVSLCSILWQKLHLRSIKWKRKKPILSVIPPENYNRGMVVARWNSCQPAMKSLFYSFCQKRTVISTFTTKFEFFENILSSVCVWKNFGFSKPILRHKSIVVMQNVLNSSFCNVLWQYWEYLCRTICFYLQQGFLFLVNPIFLEKVQLFLL